MRALLFGSISTIADTSELQREAFNRAFAQHGLDWQWDRETYTAMLGESGGRSRVAEYARSRGEDVDATAVHATKSAQFQQLLGEGSISARPGVVETIKDAKAAGLKVGFVTTTSPDNVAALLGALTPTVTAADFDVLVDSDQVDQPKPDAASYRFALRQLDVPAGEGVAIEDNVDGAKAAAAAGVACVAFPNENTAAAEFDAAAARVDHLDLAELRRLVEA